MKRSLHMWAAAGTLMSFLESIEPQWGHLGTSPAPRTSVSNVWSQGSQ